MSRIPKDVADVVVERADGWCEAMLPHGCTGRAEHLHHRRLRSQQGGHEVANLIHICHMCHDWIHRNPRESYQRGLLVRSTCDPELEVLMYRCSEWVFLRPDGRVLEGRKS